MSVNTTGMKYCKSHSLILMLVPILTAARQALAAHHLGLNSHIAWEWFKIMLSNKCLEGKKSKNPLQEIIWSITTSQHSIVIMNNLKMLTYPKEKKKGRGEYTAKPIVQQTVWDKPGIWFLFLATFWHVTSPVHSHLSCYWDKAFHLQLVSYDLCHAGIQECKSRTAYREPQEMFPAQKKVAQDTYGLGWLRSLNANLPIKLLNISKADRVSDWRMFNTTPLTTAKQSHRRI